MASVPSSSSLEEQATGMVALAREVRTRISPVNPNRILDPSILSSLEETLNQTNLMKRLPSRILSEVDEAGTALWNTCSQATRVFAGNRENMEVLSRARALAFGLMELAASNTSSGHLRALKVAIAAARSCVETEQLSIGIQILAAGAGRLEALQTSAEPIAPLELNSLAVDFYSLRARIASLQSRWDIAEHLFFKLPLTSFITNREVVSEVAFNIGCDALSSSESETAIRWLERALEQMYILAAHQCQSGCPENLDLHIRHALVRAYLHAKTPEAWDKLKEQMKGLQVDYGTTPAVLFLQLEINRLVPKPRVDDFFNALKTLMEIHEFNDTNLSLFHNYIEFSKCLSLGLALNAYQCLLLNIPIDKQDWFQNSFLRFVSFVASITTGSQLLSQECIDAIRETAEALKKRGFVSLSLEIAHAALISIWGRIDEAMINNRFHVAAKWCHLVLDNDIFKNISTVNRRKILRKVYFIALQYGDTELAEEMMQESVNRTGDIIDPNDLFLAYKLRLLEGHDIFEYVYSYFFCSVGHFPSHLGSQLSKYESLSCHRRYDMVECIQKIIDQTQAGANFDEEPDTFEKYLFPLFLLTVELREPEFDERKLELVVRIIRLASSEREATLKDKPSSPIASELEWIASRSYHLARILLKHSRTKQLEQLMDAMQDLASVYSKGPGCNPNIVQQLGLFIPFVRLIAHGICTRTLTDREERKKNFEKMSEYIQAIRKMEIPNPDWYGFTASQIVTAFELEVSIALEVWTSFESVLEHSIREAIGFQHTRWAMDTLLSFELPIKYRVLGVKLITFSIFEKAYLHPDRRKTLLHYLRILFDLCMSGATTNPQPSPFDPSLHDPPEKYLELAEGVIDQALQSAEDEAYLNTAEHREQHALHDSSNESLQCVHYPYPAPELEHLATVAFNQAMDFYKEEKDMECRRWAKKATRLAEAMDHDEGQREAGEGVKLARVFRKRLNELFRGVR